MWSLLLAIPTFFDNTENIVFPNDATGAVYNNIIMI